MCDAGAGIKGLNLSPSDRGRYGDTTDGWASMDRPCYEAMRGSFTMITRRWSLPPVVDGGVELSGRRIGVGK